MAYVWYCRPLLVEFGTCNIYDSNIIFTLVHDTVEASIVATEVLEGGHCAVLVARSCRKWFYKHDLTPQGEGSSCGRRRKARDLGERSDMTSDLHLSPHIACVRRNHARRTGCWVVVEVTDAVVSLNCT